ncbi:MAG: alpha/beta hydrolase [Pseudomonadota bacterium]
MKLCLVPMPLLLAASAWPALAATPAISAKSFRDDAFPQVEARYPGGIVARPHVEFANYVGYRPLQLDLYLHADRAKAKARPLVIWIHGGGWSRGDSRQSGAFTDFPGVLASLAARGYVVASVDYRMSDEAAFPAPVQDVKAAIRYLRERAADFGVDPSRVILWGGSAGGHLAALAATTCHVAAFAPPPSTGRLSRTAAASAQALSQSDCVQGAAIWYGPFDLDRHRVQRSPALGDNVSALLRCRDDACIEPAKRASPIGYVDATTPPMLLVHGTADDEVEYGQSELMAAALKRVSVPVDTLFIPDANHGFIGKSLEDTRRFSLLALDRTFAFFDRITRR